MQPHVTTTVSPAHQPPLATENENKHTKIKSPRKASVLKRRSTKAPFGNENKEPNHAKAVSFLEPNMNINTIENKMVASTPNNPKFDLGLADTFNLPREHNTTSKPNESPFTAFCKGLHLSPGPVIACVSPNIYGRNGGPFGSEAGNFISPSPMGLQLGPDNGSSSPLFPRKHITKLDFSNRFVMFKSNPDEISIEHDDSNKFGDQQLEPSLTYDENLPSSPKFNFPLKRSIYTNKNLIPTHTRSTDIYSQSPLGVGAEMPVEEPEEQEEPRHQPLARLNEEDVEVDMVPVRKLVRSPSPQRKLTFDAGEQKGRMADTIIQRSYSFGMASELNGQYGNVKKMRGEDEEDEEADYEGSNGSHSLSGSKKKVCCNCKKSRCLKLYCDCFARGKGCTKDCNCQNCLNNDANAEERNAAMQNTLERNPIAFKPKVNLTDAPEIVEVKDTHVRHIKGCNCKKSGCLKKYCECYQAGAKCTDVCKCENCKNTSHSGHRKGSQSYGIYASASLENHEGSRMKLESPASDMLHSSKPNARTFSFLEHEEGENSIYEEEREEGDDVKKYSNPRKHIFSTQKVPFIVQSDHGKASHAKEGDSDDHVDHERPKSSSKKKERLRKKSATITAPPKTPTSATDLQKKNFENTPSPEKQSSVSGGRARRNVRPFGHLNPDEYELGK